VQDFTFNKDNSPEYLTAGTHEFTWDGKDEQKRPMPPGVYLCFVNARVGNKSYDFGGQTEIP